MSTWPINCEIFLWIRVNSNVDPGWLSGGYPQIVISATQIPLGTTKKACQDDPTAKDAIQEIAAALHGKWSNQCRCTNCQLMVWPSSNLAFFVQFFFHQVIVGWHLSSHLRPQAVEWLPARGCESPAGKDDDLRNSTCYGEVFFCGIYDGTYQLKLMCPAKYHVFRVASAWCVKLLVPHLPCSNCLNLCGWLHWTFPNFARHISVLLIDRVDITMFW